MDAAALDTHAVFKRLVSAGMSDPAAEALALELLALAQKREDAELEKKLLLLDREIEAMRIEIRMEVAQDNKRFEAYQSEVRSDLERLELRLKHDLTVRLGTMMAGVVVVVATVVKLVH